MIKRRVQCFAHGRPGDWEAVCVDLDIAVQGASFDEVRWSLNAAVETYVADARAGDEASALRLLSRRAPLTTRIRLAASYLAHIVLANDGDNREFQAGFDLPCHA